jgi:hypothetical protein
MRSISIALMLTAGSLVVACGGRNCGRGTEASGSECVPAHATPDPLIGFWIVEPSGTYAATRCAFYSTGEWTCIWANGWTSTWNRLGENWYVFAVSNGNPCDGRTTFADDNNSVTIVLNCNGGYQDGWTYTLSRVPAG